MDHSIKARWIFLFFLLVWCAVSANATTYYWGAANQTLSAATDEVSAGYYGATTLHAVDSDLAVGNIKSGTTIFGILGTYVSASYGLPKTGQQPTRPTGVPFATGDDGYYASPEAGNDVGYPRGTGSWTAYNTARFTDNGDGTISDNATGLMWAKDGNGEGCLSGVTKTWSNAITSMEALSFAGYTDWRLPNAKELVSIADYGRSSPAIDPVFTNTKSNYYWTSTTYLPSTSFAWYMDFTMGMLYYSRAKTSDCYVRAVRGGQ